MAEEVEVELAVSRPERDRWKHEPIETEGPVDRGEDEDDA